ncbi:biotin/lipoyl-binding protein, partial [Escherichia coli]|nr:biotin/lipoyl-binding protein [Escherichia coli]
PTRDIRLGAIVAMLFFVLFLGWAAFIRLDAAAYAPGTLVVSGQRQSVQHRDGGVVGRIFVREGQRVERGQLLMQLAAAEVQAQERAL